MQLPSVDSHLSATHALLEFIDVNQPLVVLTGAGCSTDSGIPGYRDENGDWKHRQPIQYQDFLDNPNARKRYWSRSMLGWPRINSAVPNPAHLALAQLEHHGFISYLVTQNVDGLHQKAGSISILELHGGQDSVVCVVCSYKLSRALVQDILLEQNPEYNPVVEIYVPDGDASVTEPDISSFRVPDCPCCGGVLKPDVTFFGEPVPRSRVACVTVALDQARALLVIGSSLMVFSGYRFCRYARAQEKPVAVLNRGRTRADADISLKIGLPCQTVLPEICRRLL